MTLAERPDARFVVIGGSAPAISAASHLQPDLVLFRTKHGNLPFSNEFFRLRLHRDSPLWTPLVAASLEVYGLNHLSEVTGYLIQSNPSSAGQWFMGYNHVLDRLNSARTDDYPLPLDPNYIRQIQPIDRPIIKYGQAEINLLRETGGSYLHPDFLSAVWQSSGGKIFEGTTILDNILAKALEASNGTVRENVKVAGINMNPQGSGKLQLTVESDSGSNKKTESIDTSDVVISVGPWTSDINLEGLNLEIPPNSSPPSVLFPKKIELPPGLAELHSIVMLDFSNNVIQRIAELTVFQLLDKSLHEERRNKLKSLSLLKESNITIDEENLDILVENIKTNIEKQLLDYGRNGPLIQNTNGAYITREHPVYATRQKQSGLSWDDYVKQGTWRKIMLGREGEEKADVNDWPPHLPKATSGESSPSGKEIERVIQNNSKRRENILKYSYGITPFIDALLYAVDYIGDDSINGSLLNGLGDSNSVINARKNEMLKLLKEDMPVQSGFYHMTTGIKVTSATRSDYSELLHKYHETGLYNDMIFYDENIRRLEKAGINPYQQIDTSYLSSYSDQLPLYMYKYPFAILSMSSSYSNNDGSFTIADVDLPYLDTLKAGDNLLSVMGWFRGRGYMAGPGAGRLLAEKHKQIRENRYDPYSKFGKFMENFSIIRMYNPSLMDRLLEDRITGGSGDI